MKEEKAKSRSSEIFPSLIITIGVIIAGAIIYINNSEKLTPPVISQEEPAIESQQAHNQTYSQEGQKINIIGEGDNPVLGESDAPVTMVVFGDYQCHFHKKFSTETRPQIEEKYVKNGKVKIVFRDFAFVGDESNWAAEAANCAFDQGKYVEYAEKLYQIQKGHDPTAFSQDNLKKLAKDLSLDTNQFNQCFDSGKYVQEVKEDFEEAKELGVSGTPTVFINGRKLAGAQPFKEFEKIIEEELTI